MPEADSCEHPLQRATRMCQCYSTVKGLLTAELQCKEKNNFMKKLPTEKWKIAFFYQQVNFTSSDSTVHVLEETNIVYYSVKLTNLRAELVICLLKCKRSSRKFP